MSNYQIKNENFAYIDGANLYKGLKVFDWRLDYGRFRIWLKEKYNVERAYIFIGLVPKYKDLYTYLQESGFTLIFKETVYGDSGKPKGNCDADLVLRAVCDVYENRFDKAIIVSSDGDYSSLVKFLQERDKLKIILSPSNVDKCSILLKKTNAPIAYINDQKSILEIRNKKAPDRDKTP
ncbi:MAG: NYN domain-containing protein [Parcubacteria group bacterium]|nr:NYN domain-containing protein [Parcubacteria group bacterium]